MTAQVTAQQATDPWAKAGPMVRATTDPGSPYYAVFVTPGNGIVVQWRATAGGSSTQLVTTGTVPAYLQIGRYTTTGSNPQTYYTAYTSPDGSTWTAIAGSTQVLSMNGSLLAGLRHHLARSGHRLGRHAQLGAGDGHGVRAAGDLPVHVELRGHRHGHPGTRRPEPVGRQPGR